MFLYLLFVLICENNRLFLVVKLNVSSVVEMTFVMEFFSIFFCFLFTKNFLQEKFVLFKITTCIISKFKKNILKTGPMTPQQTRKNDLKATKAKQIKC